MTKTLSQALAAANSTTTAGAGTCLHTCSEWWLGRASGENTAFIDWQNSKHKVAATASPEVGMLAHWRHTAAGSARHKMANGNPGHIALVVRVDKDGTVWVRSTDMASNGTYSEGHVSTVRLIDVTKHMGLIFDGYARDIAGVLVVPVPSPTATPKKAPMTNTKNNVELGREYFEKALANAKKNKKTKRVAKLEAALTAAPKK